MSVECTGSPTGEGTFDLRRAVDEGRTHHFPCVIPSEEPERNMIEGGRAVNHVEHNEDDLSLGPLSSEVPPHAPMLLLSEDGTIQGLTNGARRLLEHPPDASIEPCFFAHVHGQNLRRVMQDLARMATRRKGPGGSCACGPEMVGGAGIGRGPSASPVPQTTAFACASVAYDGTLVRILSFVEGNGDRLVVLEREAEERSPGR